MDPAILVTEAAKLGFIVLLLLFAVVYLVRRDDRIQKDDRERTARMLSDSRTDCIKREEDLSSRLRSVEDRQHGENAEHLKQNSLALTHASAALEINARAFEALARKDSDIHALERKKT